jgi:hypothetical protein
MFDTAEVSSSTAKALAHQQPAVKVWLHLAAVPLQHYRPHLAGTRQLSNPPSYGTKPAQPHQGNR